MVSIASLGGNTSSGKSKATSVSSDQATSTQSIAFADLFQQLYSNAAATAAGISGTGFGQSAAQLFSSGQGFLSQLQGGVAQQYMADRLTGPDPALASQLEQLQAGLGELFRNELNPAITSSAVAAGGLGGGRQGVAQGVAMGQIANQYAQGASQLLASSQAQRDALSGQLMMGQVAGAQAGLGGLESLLGIAQSEAGSPLLGASLLSQILGSPTVLTQSQSSGYSTMEQSSKQSSKQFNIGFG